jgi:hypothetical protein
MDGLNCFESVEQPLTAKITLTGKGKRGIDGILNSRSPPNLNSFTLETFEYDAMGCGEMRWGAAQHGAVQSKPHLDRRRVELDP